jgi:hypothetical protein
MAVAKCLKILTITLIGGARDTLGASTCVCAARLCDGYIRTKQQQDTLLLVLGLSVLGQLYVFTNDLYNYERTCTDNDVL